MSAWTERQTEFLLRHRTMPADKVARKVSMLGPARSHHAVASKRQELGLRNYVTENTRQVSGMKGGLISAGWPRLANPGHDDDARRAQDRNYMQALLRDLQQQREAA